MKKTFKVVMLPTNKKAKVGQLNLASYNTNPLELIHYVITGEGLQPQHLYIISDDEIKEGDWYMNKFGRLSIKVIGDKSNEGDKKIVATTDNSITIKNDITNPNFDEYPYSPLPQLPESFIQAFVKAYNEGKPITEVDLEIEELSTMEEMLQNEKYVPNNTFTSKIKTRPDNTVIVHQSKIYSREEVIKLCAKAWDESYAVNVRKKDMLTSDNLTREPVHFNKFIQDNL